ncbi:hypothetical protein [Brevundimonas diminuta]|uniref:hypothetical protein n=1 Tax=Brevundimonas diminuta TaxID=293 RepID=UPI001F5834E8|nr:hypothetical protein [Brevundimonas diminuta]
MTDGRSSRRILAILAAFAGWMFILWAVASFIDLGDGETWDQTKPRYAEMFENRGFDVNEFGFYKISRSQHPREFKTIVILRGVMPSVFFGVLCAVSALGWSAQPKLIPSGQE